MTPPADTPEEEAKDEQSIGHVVLLMVRNPKAVAACAATLVVTLGGWTVYREGNRPAPEPTAVIMRMDKTLREVRDDVVKVKLTTDAILQTMPERQRAQAQKILELQMAAIQAARQAQQ